MNGRVYAQRGTEAGWLTSDHRRAPVNIEEVRLTPDLNASCTMDVDAPSGLRLLNEMIAAGYSILVGDTTIHRAPAAPSASPFTPV